MDMQSRVNFGWEKGHTEQSKFWMEKIKGLSPNHVCSSQDGHILCRVDFEWTN